MPERVDFAGTLRPGSRDVNTSGRKRAHLGIATDTFGPRWSPVRTAMCERPRPARAERVMEPPETVPSRRSRQGSGAGAPFAAVLRANRAEAPFAARELGPRRLRTSPHGAEHEQHLPAPDSAPGAGGASCPQRRPAPGMRESRRSGEGTGTRPGSGHEPLCGVAPRAYPPGVPGQAAASKPVSEASFFSSSSACFSI
jgi:hypothetical protein